MGGSGSGCRSDKKGVAEDYRHIDVNRWNRERIFDKPGYTTTWAWSNSQGKRVASIGLTVLDQGVELFYTSTPFGGQPEDIRYQVRLDYSSCNYGGLRPWFICPSCGRRVAKLFCRGGYFLCRHCHQLAYQSQSENRTFRVLRKVQNKRIRLGGSVSTLEPLPGRPKGMHWKTYRRRRNELECLENLMWGAMARQIGIHISEPSGG